MDYMPFLASDHLSRRSLLHESSQLPEISIGSIGFLQLSHFPLPPGFGVCPALPRARSRLTMRMHRFQSSLSLLWCYALRFMLAVKLAMDHGFIPMLSRSNL